MGTRLYFKLQGIRTAYLFIKYFFTFFSKLLKYNIDSKTCTHNTACTVFTGFLP